RRLLLSGLPMHGRWISPLASRLSRGSPIFSLCAHAHGIARQPTPDLGCTDMIRLLLILAIAFLQTIALAGEIPDGRVRVAGLGWTMSPRSGQVLPPGTPCASSTLFLNLCASTGAIL